MSVSLEKMFPGNNKLVTYDPKGAAKTFSECWPDSLSGAAAKRDLKWEVKKFDSIEKALETIVKGHHTRINAKEAAEEKKVTENG